MPKAKPNEVTLKLDGAVVLRGSIIIFKTNTLGRYFARIDTKDGQHVEVYDEEDQSDPK